MKTLKGIFVEYGTVAVVVYLVLFFLVWLGFWAAIRLGWEPTTVAGETGAWVASYLATKITQPLRIIATLALTPFIAKIYERITGRTPQSVQLPPAREEKRN